jgi:hypothetical protein
MADHPDDVAFVSADRLAPVRQRLRLRGQARAPVTSDATVIGTVKAAACRT